MLGNNRLVNCNDKLIFKLLYNFILLN